ncbi:MAG TPA: beta-N-acetylhexosaminidase [Terriglobia bacterium]|nr:beta-N-acetylhexosaminidase [Terriglobia bacterium]
MIPRAGMSPKRTNGRSFGCTAFCILLVSLPALGQEHSPLLPRPQELRYGSGKLALHGLVITFGTTPTSEDRFAAQQLSAALSDKAHTDVPVATEPTSSPSIQLNRTGSAPDLAQPGDKPGPDSPEAYSIRITPGGAEVRARSSRGVFYAVQTLRQLAEGEGSSAALPVVEIHDWPSLAYRGTMVDMSHGPLPTEKEVERQLDFLSRFKDNQYYFYNEASIELKGYPLLNPTGRFTQEEIRRIIAYGRQRHVDVVPCLELYGHLHDLFRVEKYADLADMPHGTEFNPRHPKVADLLNDWINQFAQLFPSRFVHIGFDETFQIEEAAQASGGAAEPAKLFIEQLRRVAGAFQQHGKTVMAWGDIMVKYPAILAQLPPGLIAIAWEYDPGPPEHYAARLGPLPAHHVPHMIASGVTSWNSVTPDFLRSYANIDTFLAEGRKSGTLGLMNTIWTDDGQMLMRMTLPGMAYGAAAAWQTAPMDEASFAGEYTRLVYPAKVAPDVATALDDLSRSEVGLQKVLGDESMVALWGNPFIPSTLEKCTQHQADLRQVRLLAEDAEEHLDRALADGGDPATLSSLLFGSRLLDYAGQKFQTAPELEAMWRKLGPRRPKDDLWWNEWDSQVIYQDHSRLVDLLDAITELRGEYRLEWLAEYTPYRLQSALGRWNAEYEYWRQLQARLHAFSDASHEGDPLPPLESFGLAK